MYTVAKGKRKQEESNELKKGPWTHEEDSILIHFIDRHGEGRWNLLARCSGLMRSGKSCRLRWLNYLKPDVKRGNLTPQEQLLILELHSKWGNRWSSIARHLPGRTDNEIKNYWRTRVQRQARQLQIDTNSAKFRDLIRWYWIPRLLERIESSSPIKSLDSTPPLFDNVTHASVPETLSAITQNNLYHLNYSDDSISENSITGVSSVSMEISQIPELYELPISSTETLDNVNCSSFQKVYNADNNHDLEDLSLASMSAPNFNYSESSCLMMENNWIGEGCDTLWCWPQM